MSTQRTIWDACYCHQRGGVMAKVYICTADSAVVRPAIKVFLNTVPDDKAPRRSGSAK